jgi:hypothetical protein
VRYQQPERRPISSVWTHFYKVVFPAVWLGVLGVPFLSEGPSTRWFLAPVLIFAVALYWILISPLKRVWIGDKAFYVSNYRKEIQIPFSQVGKVTCNSLINIQPITIHFHADTEFGRKVVFMPTVSLSSFLGVHPMVDELRDLIRRNTPP